METTIIYSKDNKNYNRYGEEVVFCKNCGAPTTMTGTKLCDGCWEAERHYFFEGLAENRKSKKSLRDYFAAKAMQGMIIHWEVSNDVVNIVKWAYVFADAMLKERLK